MAIRYGVLFSTVDDTANPSALTCCIGFSNAAKACNVWHDRGFPLVDAAISEDKGRNVLQVVSSFFRDSQQLQYRRTAPRARRDRFRSADLEHRVPDAAEGELPPGSTLARPCPAGSADRQRPGDLDPTAVACVPGPGRQRQRGTGGTENPAPGPALAVAGTALDHDAASGERLGRPDQGRSHGRSYAEGAAAPESVRHLRPAGVQIRGRRDPGLPHRSERPGTRYRQVPGKAGRTAQLSSRRRQLRPRGAAGDPGLPLSGSHLHACHRAAALRADEVEGAGVATHGQRLPIAARAGGATARRSRRRRHRAGAGAGRLRPGHLRRQHVVQDPRPRPARLRQAHGDVRDSGPRPTGSGCSPTAAWRNRARRRGRRRPPCLLARSAA